MHFKYLIYIIFIIFQAQALHADWSRTRASVMGTEIAVEIWHSKQENADQAVAAIISEMHRIDELMSVYKTSSEMSRVNASAADHAVAVSTELFQLIRQALEFSVATHGAFDITYASVGYLYDYRASKRPDQQAINAALPGIDYRLVQLDENKETIRFLKSGVRIDLGGIAKGYAVDSAINLLSHYGIEHARITAGGDTRVLGSHLGRPWTVGIRDPRNADKTIVVIPLLDEAISTSGDYERYFDDSGIRYHHIIDPATGDSARKVQSVSVIGPESVVTDVLSTSLFVLGIEEGIALIDRMENYEAIIIDNQGELHYSEGLRQLEQSARQKKWQISRNFTLHASL